MPTQLIKPRRFGDDRGWFCEPFNQRTFAGLGIDAAFVQDNHSYSQPVGVVRGLHFQTPPHAQAKLVRCIRGAIWDVAVDVRRGSPTYGQWVAAELSAENGLQLWVPVGFAHGFVTLAEGAEVEYKVTDFYAPQCEGGLVWNDPTLALPWPLGAIAAVLSPKDEVLPKFADFVSPFDYDGVPMASLQTFA